MSDEPAPPRQSGLTLLLAVVAVLGSAVGVFIYYSMQQRQAAVGIAGFDLSQTSGKPAASSSSSSPLQVQNSLTMINTAGTPRMRAGAGSSGGAAAPTSEQRQREAEFLRQYGAVLGQYQGRLTEITTRYYKESPVVRDVDKAFGAMPRFMTLRQRYEKDGDPFQFSRDALALPEVRAEISKRMADPAVWKAAIGMISETLQKQPPPGPIYDAAKKFMIADPSVANYVETDLTDNVQKNMNTAVGAMSSSAAEMGPLTKLLNDVHPSSAKPASPQ